MLRKLFKKVDKNEKYRQLIEKTIIDSQLRSCLFQHEYLDKNYSALIGTVKGEAKLINFITAKNIIFAGEDFEKRRNCIESVLLTLLAKNTEKTLECYFFDTDSNYAEYKDLPQTKGYANDVVGLVQIVGELFVEMNRRHAILKHYNMKKVDRIGYHHYVFVVDDLSFILNADIPEETLINLEKVLSVGHLYGIHCILNSSVNITDVVDEAMVSNYQTRIALGPVLKQESLALLDEMPRIEEQSSKVEEDGRVFRIVDKKGRDDDLPDEHYSLNVLKISDDQKHHILQSWKNGLTL